MVIYDDLLFAGSAYLPPDFGQNGTAIADDLIVIPGFVSALTPPTTGEEPDPPTGVVASPIGSHTMAVTFVPPVNNGGSAITGYVVTSIPSGGIDTNSGSTALTHIITNLTNGVSYIFTVHATNEFGDSAESAPSAPITASIVISLTLVDPVNVPRPNLAGLKWAFFEEVTPDLFNAPADRGIGETTDASANLIIPVQTSLDAGDIGWLIITDSDGTVTQFPPHSAFSGPVQLS